MVIGIVDRLEQEILERELFLRAAERSFFPGQEIMNAVLRIELQTEINLREEMMWLLAEGAKSIFMDITWQHEAYLAGGVEAIDELHEADLIDEHLRDAWHLIATGDPDDILQGTTVIVQHEQLVSLRDMYEDINDMLPVPWITEAMADEAHSGIDGVPSFRDAIPGGNFTDTDMNPDDNDRWVWMRDFIIPFFGDLTAEERATLIDNAYKHFRPEFGDEIR